MSQHHTEQQSSSARLSIVSLMEQIDQSTELVEGLGFIRDVCYAWDADEIPPSKNNMRALGSQLFNVEQQIERFSTTFKCLFDSYSELQKRPRHAEADEQRIIELFTCNQEMLAHSNIQLGRPELYGSDAFIENYRMQNELMKRSRDLLIALRTSESGQ